MTTPFQEYQKKTNATAIYPESCAMEYLILGLASEAGEIAGVYKKYLRDHEYYSVMKSKTISELGDLMWYVAQICERLDLNFEEILQENIEKLAARQKNNTLQGSGDNR